MSAKILFFFLFASLIDSKANGLPALCPSVLDLKPCKYNANSIFCDDIRGVFNLDTISTIVDIKCLNSSFYKFSLYNTSLETIGNVFRFVSFEVISITNNQNLSAISEKAFTGSQNTLSIINVIENHNLSDSGINQSSIFEWMSAFRPIDYIIMSHNAIQEVTNQLFTDDNSRHHFERLSYLNLRQNHITRIESKTFVGLSEMKSINLGQNRIDFIDESAFVLSGNITSAQISLDWNKLDSTSFASNWLTMISNRTSAKIVVDLSHNNITFLDQHVFQSILKEYDIDLILDDNPFRCDCGAKWLIADRTTYQSKVRAICPDEKYFWIKSDSDFDHC